MRKLRGRPRLPDLNGRRASDAASPRPGVQAATADAAASGTRPSIALDDLLLDETSECASEWDVFDFHWIDQKPG
jgi:hypothetical protein